MRGNQEWVLEALPGTFPPSPVDTTPGWGQGKANGVRSSLSLGTNFNGGHQKTQ